MTSAAMTTAALPLVRETETVPLASLRDHPRNYRLHPEDQISQLKSSLQEHGVYRNVVVARDGTILAGHGVVQAAREIGLTEIRVVRLPLDPESPAALRVLVGDNEIEHLAEQDDRLLTELLKELAETEGEGGLAGTGYDEAMAANLAFVTRPASEIRDHDEAQHWVGMPDYGESPATVKLIVSFEHPDLRQEFMEKIGQDTPFARSGETWSIWYPPKTEREDLASLKFEVVDE
jgi:hypothetical protein